MERNFETYSSFELFLKNGRWLQEKKKIRNMCLTAARLASLPSLWPEQS